MNPPPRHPYTIVVYDTTVHSEGPQPGEPVLEVHTVDVDPWCALERATEQLRGPDDGH